MIATCACSFVFFQAEDGIRDLVRSRGLGDVYKRQAAYMIRGNATIERDYYYTTHGVYSDQVDMPNAMSLSLIHI